MVLLSIKDFRSYIEQECSRIDRCGDQLSLIVFDFGNSYHNMDSSYLFEQIRSKKLRIIDKVGWFDKSKIGIALPGTSIEYAEKMAHDICQAHNINVDSNIGVFSFPFDGLPIFKENCQNSYLTKCNTEEWEQSEIPKSVSNLSNKNYLFWTIASFYIRSMPIWKRAMDILGSILGLLITSPLFLIITIILRIASPGPIIYKGERIGYMGKVFYCRKFRTMHSNCLTSIHEQHVINLMTNDQPFSKLDINDARIIPFGKIMRKTGLDEIPQLINILRGEMSLVGPRPELPYSLPYYEQWQKKRFNAVPGLTGLWQTSGKNAKTFKEMVRLDISYVDRKSLWLDFKILFKTFPAIIKQIIVKF